MLRLDKLIKLWRDSAALNAHINLYGFWNETAFLIPKIMDSGYVELGKKKMEFTRKG